MKQVTVVVTGADGFVGSHVVAEARRRGHHVIPVTRAVANLELAWPVGTRGDVVIHLAGLAAVGPSFDLPQRYISSNTAMFTAVCEEAGGWGNAPRVVLASTGAVYAPSAGPSFLDERAPTQPTSPYSVSKLANEAQAAYYRTRGLDVVVARPFNHIGPGQRAGFIVPDLTAALLDSVERGAELRTGNLNTMRDYSDVRDVADAYLDLAEAPDLAEPIYNIASGISRSGEEILALISSGLKQSVVRVGLDPSKARGRESTSIIRGDASALARDTGWRPKRSVERSIADYIEWLRG